VLARFFQFLNIKNKNKIYSRNDKKSYWVLFSAKYILLLQNYSELKLQQRTTDKQRNKNDEPGAGRSRIAESVKQRVGDGGNVAKLQDVLTVGRAGELRQLAQL